MASATSDNDASGAQAKFKLDDCEREDLINLLKKQLERVRLSKVKVDTLQKQLEEKDTAINDLECEVAALRQSTTSKPDVVRVNASPNESEERILIDNEQLLEENSKMKTEIALLKKERIRIDEDLAAALASNSELRSKLDDAVQEAVALKEQQTATDVFSLELKDYEKKMRQLNQSLKETQCALESATAEKKELSEQLCAHKDSSVRVSSECSTLMAQLQEAKQELCDEQQRTASLQTSLDRLQDNFSVLAAARNDERLAFEEKIGQNEVLVEMLRKNHEQKQNELRIAINERDLLKARLEELGNDYESYKSRARYVLEQRAQSSNEQVNQSIDFNAANDAISDLKRTLQLLRFAHDEALKLARKDRVLREKAESSARSAKAEIVEIYDHMAIVREELFNSRTELKDRNEECAHYQKQISDLEKRVQDENRENLQVIKMLKEDIAKREKVENTLTDEVQNAKKRYQKAMNLLEEWKNLSSRPASTDIPQASSERRQSDHQQPHIETLKTPPYGALEIQQEETLEDVLFGDVGSPELLSEEAHVLSIPALLEEMKHLKKNLLHAQELLSETEATNATLIDQSRLLKEEIRRLQRNEERLSHVENTEYLKNIIIKFLSPERVSGERQQLIPILSTMLQLSPDEVDNLNRSAAQDDAVPPRDSENSWGSLLRWGRLN